MFDPSEFAQGVTYRPRRTTKVLVIVGGLLLVAFGAGFALIPWFEPQRSWGDQFIMYLVGGVIILLGGLCFPATRARLVLYPDRLESYTVFDLRIVKREEIVGIRFQPKATISLYGVNQKALAHLSSLLIFDEKVDRWLDGIPNFDVEDYQRAVRDIEQDLRLGNAPEERTARHARIHKWTGWLNGACFVMLVWAVVWPNPRDVLLAVLVCFPAFPLLMLRRLGSSVEIDRTRLSPRNAMAVPLIIPGMALAILATRDCSPINKEDLIFPGVVGLALAIAALYWAGSRFRTYHLLSAVPFLCVHFLSALMLANQRFDPGPVSELHAEVIGTQRTEKRSGSPCYSVEVRWANPDVITKRVGVSKSQYDKANVGDPFSVFVYPGALTIPWWSRSDRGGFEASRSCR